jgi:hypothetical protein
MKRSFLTSWTCESLLTCACISISFFSTYTKCLLFCFFCSDNENPKKDAATAPIVDAPTIDEPPSQEADVVPRLPEAVVKKAASHAFKRLKKASAVSTSLDAHRPTSSDDDVSTTLLLEAYSF